ncbi:TolC family protein [Providencia rettgeri]|uniref:TolC family protein n=1 Tax=Providencia rettgeri TaxID=587 RepID=A0A939NL70_PRORE|nr:TolC family protein [Providencia rettgeri]MBO1928959.1 TolC family protein [Providencia rettgeri]
MFPRISLTASTGYSSSEVKNLFDSDSRVWSFAPQINIPIFNAGKLKSELRLAEIRKSGAVISYEQTIQTAFKDVADGLSGLETFGLQIMAQREP